MWHNLCPYKFLVIINFLKKHADTVPTVKGMGASAMSVRKSVNTKKVSLHLKYFLCEMNIMMNQIMKSKEISESKQSFWRWAFYYCRWAVFFVVHVLPKDSGIITIWNNHVMN